MISIVTCRDHFIMEYLGILWKCTLVGRGHQARAADACESYVPGVLGMVTGLDQPGVLGHH